MPYLGIKSICCEVCVWGGFPFVQEKVLLHWHPAQCAVPFCVPFCQFQLAACPLELYNFPIFPGQRVL